MAEFENNYGLRSDLAKKIDLYRTNPTAIQTTILNYLSSVLDGQVDIVDPTNPFVFLLEASAVTASSIMEGYIDSIRRQFPTLSGTESDLYHHMSDEDYVGRFAVPTRATITAAVLKEDIKQKGVLNTIDNSHSFTIPRYTSFITNNVKFTSLHPITITEHTTGEIVIQRDLTIDNALDNTGTTLLPYNIHKVSEVESWVYFDIPCVQVSIETHDFIVNTGGVFTKTINLKEDFVYADAYHQVGNDWIKLKTTHSDIIFDQNTPTVLLKLKEEYLRENDTSKSVGSLEVIIPPEYLISGQIGSNIRVVVYTSKGKLSMELGEVPMSDWTRNTIVVNPDIDSDQYTSSYYSITMSVFSDTRVEGGRNKLSYNDLRTKIINNTVGRLNTPITEHDIKEVLDRDGFLSIKAIDVISSRRYMATKTYDGSGLANTTDTVPTLATISITDLDINNNDRITDHGNGRYSIKTRSVFINESGKMRLLTNMENTTMNGYGVVDLVEELNRNEYFYNPYLYVLYKKQDGELEAKAYDMENPKINYVNWIDTNISLGVLISTESYKIEKTSTGYEIVVATISNDAYKNLANNTRYLQLSFKGNNSSRYYIYANTPPTLASNGEYIFRIPIDTNYDIDDDNNLVITNLYNNGIAGQNVSVPLDASFDIYYITTDNTVPSNYTSMDNEIGSPIPGSKVISKEEMSVELGKRLDWLWNRSRVYNHEYIYKTYPTDVPDTYTRDIYLTDPETGGIYHIDPNDCTSGITYTIVHHKGDPVLDADGNPVYKHRKGDPVLGPDGNPLIDLNKGLTIEMDMFLFEAVYHYSNDQIYVDYRDYIRRITTQRATSTMEDFNKRLLENTELYYGSKITHGNIQSVSGGTETTTTARKKFTITLYISGDVLINDDVTKRTKASISEIIHKELLTGTISMSKIREVITSISEIYKGIDIEIDGKEYRGLIETKSEIEGFALRKKAIITEDNEVGVEYDIDIKYISI